LIVKEIGSVFPLPVIVPRIYRDRHLPKCRSLLTISDAMSLNGFLSGHTEQQAEQGEF